MSMMGKTRTLVVLGVVALAGALAGCGGQRGPCAQMAVTWDIERNDPAHTPLSCLQAGASDVDISVGDMVVTRACTDYSAITPPIPAGSYPVSLDLIDIGNNVISTFSTPTLVDFFSCQTTDLGNVTFPVN